MRQGSALYHMFLAFIAQFTADSNSMQSMDYGLNCEPMSSNKPAFFHNSLSQIFHLRDGKLASYYTGMLAD